MASETSSTSRNEGSAGWSIGGIVADGWSGAVRAALMAVAVGALGGRASAHGGETTGIHDAPLALALFLGGICLVGASAYLDARREPNRTYVDAGVFLGIGATLVGIAAYWF